MTKYAIVPVKVLEEVKRLIGVACEPLVDGISEPLSVDERKEMWANACKAHAMLTARPPLDAEMQQALELAQRMDEAAKSSSYYAKCRDPEVAIARALLRANGEEVT